MDESKYIAYAVSRSFQQGIGDWYHTNTRWKQNVNSVAICLKFGALLSIAEPVLNIRRKGSGMGAMINKGAERSGAVFHFGFWQTANPHLLQQSIFGIML